jgi:uncharacterized membrane protein
MEPKNNTNENGGKSNGNGGYRRPKRTIGQKASDALARVAGSWWFLIGLSVFLALWIALNSVAMFRQWDPYPFILLNLMLSFLAAYQAPIILMSQGRNEDRDRAKSERDHAVNRRAEREIQDMQNDLDEIKEMIRRLDRKVSDVRRAENAEAEAVQNCRRKIVNARIIGSS